MDKAVDPPERTWTPPTHAKAQHAKSVRGLGHAAEEEERAAKSSQDVVAQAEINTIHAMIPDQQSARIREIGSNAHLAEKVRRLTIDRHYVLRADALKPFYSMKNLVELKIVAGNGWTHVIQFVCEFANECVTLQALRIECENAHDMTRDEGLNLAAALAKFKYLRHLYINFYRASQLDDSVFEAFVTNIAQLETLTTLTLIFMYSAVCDFDLAARMVNKISHMQFLAQLEIMLDWNAPKALKEYIKKVQRLITRKGLNLMPFLNTLTALQKLNMLRYVKRQEYFWDLVYAENEDE